MLHFSGTTKQVLFAFRSTDCNTAGLVFKGGFNHYHVLGVELGGKFSATLTPQRGVFPSELLVGFGTQPFHETATVVQWSHVVTLVHLTEKPRVRLFGWFS